MIENKIIHTGEINKFKTFLNIHTYFNGIFVLFKNDFETKC